ncbi:hypothetical protein [uncultured Nostoc sp.]|uniref:hypothetical protein n=1 Tax=uncultured Nostoc sp. TaxID=340711 RepID=UPI0035CB6B7D
MICLFTPCCTRLRYETKPNNPNPLNAQETLAPDRHASFIYILSVASKASRCSTYKA